jgi:release factor glutamine methyltransferase
MSVEDPFYVDLLLHLEAGLEVLPDKPDETARVTLDCLWATAAGTPLTTSETRTYVRGALDDTQRARLLELVARRLDGEPLAHVTGRQDFMGIVLRTSADALIPRRETELLTRAALDRLLAHEHPAPMVVDLCTGSGNIALALAMHAPRARIWGGDLSSEAIALARDNAALIARPDVEFRVGDLTEPFATPEFLGQVDVVTCNPPYISSAKVEIMHPEIRGHEPRLAFDGGAFGINVLMRLLDEAPLLLRRGGWLLFEVGLGQGEPMRKRLARLPAFDAVEPVRDERGDIRALAACRA